MTPVNQPLSVTRGNFTISVRPDHAEFWTDFSAGRWEPETLEIFDRYIDRETLHLDIGAWIGPTALYAASKASRVIAFEPDPQAFAVLTANIALNPGASSIRAEPVAISPENGRMRLGSRGSPGDSMSSALFADQQLSWEADTCRLDSYLADWPAGSPVFFKIDIEGGEYRLLPSLAPLFRRYRSTVLLSLHQFYFLGCRCPSNFAEKLLQEGRLLLAWLPVWWSLRSFDSFQTSTDENHGFWRLLNRRVWRHSSYLLCVKRGRSA